MSRVQLALNVDDLDAAVDFHSELFETTPARLRPSGSTGRQASAKRSTPSWPT